MLRLFLRSILNVFLVKNERVSEEKEGSLKCREDGKGRDQLKEKDPRG